MVENLIDSFSQLSEASRQPDKLGGLIWVTLNDHQWMFIADDVT